MDYQGKIKVIDSVNYSNYQQAYAFEFNTEVELTTWLQAQRAQGWEVTFFSDHEVINIDPDALQLLESRVWDIIKNPHPNSLYFCFLAVI